MYFLPTRLGLGLLPATDITTAKASLVAPSIAKQPATSITTAKAAFVQPALTRDVAPPSAAPGTPGVRPGVVDTPASRLVPGRRPGVVDRSVDRSSTPLVPSGTRISASPVDRSIPTSSGTTAPPTRISPPAASAPAPARSAPTPTYMAVPVSASEVPRDAVYADPRARLRAVAAIVLDDVQRNGCNYDRRRVTELMRRYATAQGAPLSAVLHSGTYGVDVQLTINDVLGGAVAPSTCGSVASPMSQAATASTATPADLPIGPNGVQPTTSSRTGTLVVAGLVGVALIGGLFLFLAYMKKKKTST